MPTRRCLGLLPALAVALALVPLTASSAHASGGNQPSMVLIDFAPLEMTGELGKHTYDLKAVQDEKHSTFLGTSDIKGGSFVGGGLTMGLHYISSHGLRAGFEGSLMGGRMLHPEMAWGSTSTNFRGRALIGVGYQHRFGPMVLHTETQAGFDYVGLNVAGGPAGAALSSQSSSTDPTLSPLTYQLSRFSPRIGQQVGVHFVVAEAAALFVQGSLDLDGQWRAGAGISLGNFRK